MSVSSQLSPDDIDAIARRVLALMGSQALAASATPAAISNPLITIAETREFLHISTSEIYRRMQMAAPEDGKEPMPPVTRIGRRVYFKRADIEAYRRRMFDGVTNA